MTKPIEETWTAERKKHGWHIGPQPDGRCSMFANTDASTHDVQDQAARLIAAAPEMARMLLAREWTDRGEYRECESCGGIEWVSMPSHREGCVFIALMKKAGLR